MPSSQIKLGHINQRLSDVSFQHDQADYVFPFIVPEVAVDKGSDDFTVYEKGNLLQTPDDILAKNSSANEVKFAEDVDTYRTQDRGLVGYVPQTDMDNADDPIDPQIDETEVLTAAIMNNKEVRAHTLATSLITNTATPAVKWDLGGTPVQDIQDAIDAMWRPANTMVIAKRAWDTLKFHPDVIAKIGGGFTNVQMARLSMFSEMFDIPVDRIKIANAKAATKKPPQAVGIGFSDAPRIWDEELWVGWVDPRQSKKMQTFARTFAQRLSGTRRTMQTRTWFDPAKGRGGSLAIQVEHSTEERIISEDFAFVLTNTIS